MARSSPRRACEPKPPGWRAGWRGSTGSWCSRVKHARRARRSICRSTRRSLERGSLAGEAETHEHRELSHHPGGDVRRPGDPGVRPASALLRRAAVARAPARRRAAAGGRRPRRRASPRCTPTRTATSRRTTRPRRWAASSFRSTTAPSRRSSNTRSRRRRRR